MFKMAEGGDGSIENSSTATAILATSGFNIDHLLNSVSTTEQRTVPAVSSNRALLELFDHKDDINTNGITPYNFFTASSSELDKVRGATAAASSFSGTINSSTSSSIFTTKTTSTNGKNGDPTALVVTRKRRPSATITSAAAAAVVAQEPELQNTFKTELNPTFDVSTVTTIKTEETKTTTMTAGGGQNSTNSVHINVPTITTVKTEHTLTIADFGVPVDPSLSISSNMQPKVTLDRLGFNFDSGRTGLKISNNTEEKKGATSATEILSINQIVIEKLPNQPGPSTVASPSKRIALTPQSMDDIGSWVPFPPEIANTKRLKKSVTPFMLEQLNHQIRIYNLSNQFTINARKALANQSPNTRSRAKAAAATGSPTKSNLPTPKRRRGQKEPVIPPVGLVRTMLKSPIGKRKRVQGKTPPPQPVVNMAPAPAEKKQAKPKRPQTARRSTSRSMPTFEPDSPIPIVFVDCSFCAVSKPTIDTLGIESCLHVFCVECLQNYVQHSSEPQISCPLRDEGKCNGVLSDPEIKKLVSEEVFQKYLSRSLASALAADNQLTPCFFPGCSGICFIEEDLRLFYCPICSKLNCLSCRSTHEGQCPKKKKRKIGEELMGSVIDLAHSSEEEIESDDGDIQMSDEIAMKLPVAETEEEAKLRMEWEASWAQLVAKFNAGENGQGTAGGESDINIFQDLIKTDHVFECPICIVDVEEGQGVILQECFHRFCRECLIGSIEHSEEVRVKCPYQSGNYSCQMHISDREVRALVNDEIYDKLLTKSLAAAEMGMSNAFHCQSVNCKGWAEIANNQVQTFRCDICGKKNCVPCKAIHDALTCAEYQSRLREGEFEVASKEELNRMISKGEAMRCPTCKVVIIKNGGCDGMTCVVCQTHICWATKGPRWGPKGRGDDSAGCRCGFDGKKCHPKCSNCH